MALLFKPKKQQIHVPGFGVVQKEDFKSEHFAALMKRAGNNRDAFIKQHLEVASYGDQDLFKDAPENEQQANDPKANSDQKPKGSEKPKGKGKKDSENAE